MVCQFYDEENTWFLMSTHDEPNKLASWLENYLFSEQVQIKILDHNPGFDISRSQLDEFSRIKLSLPKSPNELNEDNNPLELGLGKLISWNKGCYVGQEVISRLDTYDKVSRCLVGLACERKDFDNLRICPELSSCVPEFRAGQALALAIIKKTALTSGGFLTTENGTSVWVVSSAR